MFKDLFLRNGSIKSSSHEEEMGIVSITWAAKIDKGNDKDTKLLEGKYYELEEITLNSGLYGIDVNGYIGAGVYQPPVYPKPTPLPEFIPAPSPLDPRKFYRSSEFDDDLINGGCR
jgi:hypothetical protein